MLPAADSPRSPPREKTRVLFVCSANLNRSPTAEKMLAGHPCYEARSCGILPESEKVCQAEDVKWADIVVCMEEWHREALRSSFPETASRRVAVLDIPDAYFRDDPHLVLLLDERLARILENYRRRGDWQESPPPQEGPTMHLPPVQISPALTDHCPRIRVLVLACRITNRNTPPELKNRIRKTLNKVAAEYPLDRIAGQSVIAATRAAYKACGKDPSRYRPSAEALRRRAAKDSGLNFVNAAVDVINLLSLETGYSISAFDAECLRGPLVWDIGRAGEIIHSIGRGPLNAEGLPVIRDPDAIIGSPTSDSARTRITLETHSLLVTTADFDGRGHVDSLRGEMESALRRWIAAQEIRVRLLPGG